MGEGKFGASKEKESVVNARVGTRCCFLLLVFFFLCSLLFQDVFSVHLLHQESTW